MKQFDVFIRGVRPERMDEAEQIKQKACQFLKVEADKLEELWNTPLGLCVRRNIVSEEAEQIQTTLAKAGLICIYRPSLKGPDLSLVEEVKGPTERIFACPQCGTEETLGIKDPDPLKCKYCFITIEKFLAIKKQQEEREQIKRRLLGNKTAQELREIALLEEEAEKKRKEQIEEEIITELYGSKLKRHKKEIVIVGCMGIILSSIVFGFTSYREEIVALFSKDNKSKPPEGLVQITPTTVAQAGGPGGAPGGPGSVQGGPDEHTEGQDALKDGYNKANKVLNSFGLDAGKLANNVSKSPGSTAGAAAGPIAGGGVNSTAVGAGNPAAAKSTPAAATGQGALSTVALLQDGQSNQEWDKFLTQLITRLLTQNANSTAHQVAQYIIDNDAYIAAMGQLLAVAGTDKQTRWLEDIINTLDTRISTLPLANQAGYFAEAGVYQKQSTGAGTLLNRAETILTQLTNPEDQLRATLKIAVADFKVKNMDAANHYFSLIPALISKIQSPTQQALARGAVSQAYGELSDIGNAGSWLESTNNLLGQANIETLKALMASYALLNQYPKSLVSAAGPDIRDELLYSGVKDALKYNSIAVAGSIINVLESPTYKALALEILADYDPNAAINSLTNAEKLIPTLSSAADKALVANRLFCHYQRIGNATKASEMQILTESNLDTLPASPAKDELLATLAKNYAQALQIDTANETIDAMQNELKQGLTRTEIASFVSASALLNKAAK